VFNKLLAIGGILVIVGGLFLLVNPVTHIPLLDANRAVLAESDADGFCAGQTFMKTRGYGNEAQMNECLDLLRRPQRCRPGHGQGRVHGHPEREQALAHHDGWPVQFLEQEVPIPWRFLDKQRSANWRR
jgi:hypothetical protein